MDKENTLLTNTVLDNFIRNQTQIKLQWASPECYAQDVLKYPGPWLLPKGDPHPHQAEGEDEEENLPHLQHTPHQVDVEVRSPEVRDMRVGMGKTLDQAYGSSYLLLNKIVQFLQSQIVHTSILNTLLTTKERKEQSG